MRIVETHELIYSIVDDLKKEKEFKNVEFIELYKIALNLYKVNLHDKIDDRLNDIKEILEIIQITK
jgi:hypothetical protein